VAGAVAAIATAQISTRGRPRRSCWSSRSRSRPPADPSRRSLWTC